MGDHLEQAAKFSKSRESTLNVSDSVSFHNHTPPYVLRFSYHHTG